MQPPDPPLGQDTPGIGAPTSVTTTAPGVPAGSERRLPSSDAGTSAIVPAPGSSRCMREYVTPDEVSDMPQASDTGTPIASMNSSTETSMGAAPDTAALS